MASPQARLCVGFPPQACRQWAMHARKQLPPDLLRLAEAQAGVISAAQMTALKAPPSSVRRWRSGWVTMARGLYCLTPPTWTSWCWAGLVRAGEGAAIGGLASAHLDELVAQAPDQITVWHTRSTVLEPLEDPTVRVVFRRGTRTGAGDPTRTDAVTSILDAAAETDEDALVALVAKALTDKKATTRALLEALAARGRTSRRGLITALCDVGSAGVESVLEWRFLTEVIRGHGLPEPIRQERVVPGTRSDNVWREYALVAELDGQLGHEQAFRDMQRDNRLAFEGCMTLRYGWHDVTTRPCEAASQLSRALQTRGWNGIRRRCGRCRRAGVS